MASSSSSSSPTSAITMEHMRVALRPKGVAVVGATERVGSVGRTVMDNLLHGYSAKCGKPNPFEVFPVNPTREECLGLKCYKSVSAIESEACEMVLVITPAARCVDVVRDCALKNSVKVVTVIAAGFKEVGPEGLKLELELVAIAREAGIAVIGPNCLGLMNPNHQLNATFAADSVLPGSVGFISQSGAMCTAFLDYALAVNQGFSAFISIGSMSDVEWSHCIEYLGEDELTKSIMIYMETIGNAGAFMKAAQKVAKKKPIVIIKAGKTEAAAAAAVSHTGSLAGSHDNFLAAMKRAGVLVVDSIDELQSVMMICSLQPKPCSKSVYIITNAGGPGVLSTDAAAIAGLEVVDLSEPMIAEFSAYLPAAWSHANPVDVLGDAKPLTYAKCLETVFKHGEKDAAVLIVLSPQSMTEPTETALAISKIEKEHRGDFKGPVLCSFMGGHQVEEGRQVLIDHSIPSFSQPDRAAQALGLLHRQIVSAESIQIRETLAIPNAKETAMKVMAAAVAEKREILTESESKDVMKAYGIPVAESIVCQTPEEAVSAAKQLQYPCVLKLNSETITHKSDVGGVKLGIKSDEEVIKAFNDIKTNVDKLGAHHFQGVSVQPMLDIASGVELLVGSTSDVQLGPMVLFGTGGCMVEIFKDAAAAVPPLTQADAAQLIASTKVSRALVPGHGERFKGCPMNEVEDVLIKFSALICDLNDVIAECEINPLLALQNRVIALDARVVLRTDSSTIPVAPPCLL